MVSDDGDGLAPFVRVGRAVEGVPQLREVVAERVDEVDRCGARQFGRELVEPGGQLPERVAGLGRARRQIVDARAKLRDGVVPAGWLGEGSERLSNLVELATERVRLLARRRLGEARRETVDMGPDVLGEALETLLERLEVSGRGRNRRDRRAKLRDLPANLVEVVDTLDERRQVAGQHREVVDPVPQPVELVAQRIGLLARRRAGEAGGEPGRPVR